MYADNQYKFIAILNKKVDLAKLLNALGHMTAGLVSLAPDLEAFRFLRYEDADGSAHPAISHYPFIVLAAKNGNQIRNVREQAKEAGILYNDFVDTMLGGSAEAQLRQTREAKESDLEYFGLCLFGEAEVIGPMTKRFSLFKG